ncbi:MAG: hypothetical protein ACOC43_03315 [Desulfohalobiaceae bacterium]
MRDSSESASLDYLEELAITLAKVRPELTVNVLILRMPWEDQERMLRYLNTQNEQALMDVLETYAEGRAWWNRYITQYLECDA